MVGRLHASAAASIPLRGNSDPCHLMSSQSTATKVYVDCCCCCCFTLLATNQSSKPTHQPYSTIPSTHQINPPTQPTNPTHQPANPPLTPNRIRFATSTPLCTPNSSPSVYCFRILVVFVRDKTSRSCSGHFIHLCPHLHLQLELANTLLHCTLLHFMMLEKPCFTFR